MDMSVQNLKEEMTQAFGTEGLQRKKDREALDTRLEGQMKVNEGKSRTSSHL